MLRIYGFDAENGGVCSIVSLIHLIQTNKQTNKQTKLFVSAISKSDNKPRALGGRSGRSSYPLLRNSIFLSFFHQRAYALAGTDPCSSGSHRVRFNRLSVTRRSGNFWAVSALSWPQDPQKETPREAGKPPRDDHPNQRSRADKVMT